MEESKKEKIRAHLPDLITHTICDDKLLLFLFGRGMLTYKEFQMITRQKSNSEQVGMLFKLIQVRKGSYPVLLKALQESGQEDIIDILVTGAVSRRLDLIFRRKELLVGGESGYNIHRLTVNWRSSIGLIREDKLVGIMSLRVLFAMAYLPQDYKIKPVLLLQHPAIANAAQTDKSTVLDSVLNLLEKYQLIQRSAAVNGPHLSLHPLIRRVTTTELHDQGEEETVLEDTFDMLFPPPRHHPTNEFIPLEIVENLEHLWKQTWKYPDLIERQSKLIPLMVSSLYDIGKDAEAREFGDSSIEKLSMVLPDYHDNMLLTLKAVGDSLLRQGRIGEASAIIRYVEKHSKSIWGEESRQTLDSMVKLGTVFAAEGKLEEALALYQKVGDKLSGMLPRNDITFLSIRYIIGTTLDHMGKPMEAARGLLEVYETLKAKPEPAANRAFFLHVIFSLGECLTGLGIHKKALRILQEGCGLKGVASGSEKLARISIIGALANLLRKTGNFKEALSGHQKAHNILKTFFGEEDYLKTLLSRRNLVGLALDLSALKRYGEAIRYLEEGLQEVHILLGEDSFEQFSFKMVLASVLTQQGRDLKRAKDILDQMKAKIVEKKWGELAFFKYGISKEIEGIGGELERKMAPPLRERDENTIQLYCDEQM